MGMPFSARLHAVRSTAPERGDVLLSWLTKIVVVFGLAGIVIFDAVSVGVTTSSVTDQGALAARAASETWQETKNLQRAYETALARALESNPSNVVDARTFRVEDDDTVHLTISREADTLVLYRWDRTAKWALVEREAKGRSVG
jgi:hypothetical protein